MEQNRALSILVHHAEPKGAAADLSGDDHQLDRVDTDPHRAVGASRVGPEEVSEGTKDPRRRDRPTRNPAGVIPRRVELCHSPEAIKGGLTRLVPHRP